MNQAFSFMQICNYLFFHNLYYYDNSGKCFGFEIITNEKSEIKNSKQKSKQSNYKFRTQMFYSYVF